MPPVSGGFGERIEEYQVLELLGKGGFAHVYKARCLRSGVFVAIKMIDKGLMESAGMVGRVRQEVTIHSRLKHPAILELYTFFEDVHYVYLVLELAHNGELARHFRLAAGGMSEKAASDVMRQVVDGVLYLHSHQILHRDLSLNNLLITKDLKVKIADFGLATQLSQPDEKHLTMCGTPNYISPEVASRSRHGLPADVWGLGCLLYTLLVGKPPFDTNHVKQTLNRVIHSDFQMPPGLSAEGRDLLDRLLRKNPSERISLVQLVRHPFLTSLTTSESHHGMENSRDSGFHTTLHTTQSTQHNRGRSEERMANSANADMLPYQRYNTGEKMCNDIKKRPMSFNVLTGINNDTSVHNNPHLTELPKTSHHECTPNYSDADDFRNRASSHNRQMEFMESDDIIRGRHDALPKSDSAIELTDQEMLDCYSKRTDGMQKNVSASCASDNKENVLSAPRFIGVPPLCSARLSEVTHRTRNAELSISQSSSVSIHFIKKRGRLREDRITEVCNISKDGMQIIIYSVEGGKGHPLTSPLPQHNPSSQEIFTYHNLPQKHWKKYLYASRFVDLVKAKTPKITLYGSKAKCHLMENGTDFEGNFYEGGKIVLSAADGLKIIDSSGNVHSNPKNLPSPVLQMYEHFQECMSRCHEVESALQGLSEGCFPLIMGRKPHPHNQPLLAHHPGSQQTTPVLPISSSIDIGSFCHNTASVSSRHNEDDKNYDSRPNMTQPRQYNNAYLDSGALAKHQGENSATLRHPMMALHNVNSNLDSVQQNHQDFYDGYR